MKSKQLIGNYVRLVGQPSKKYLAAHVDTALGFNPQFMNKLTVLLNNVLRTSLKPDTQNIFLTNLLEISEIRKTSIEARVPEPFPFRTKK